MLSMNNINDKQKMMEYYRTSDMLNLLYFFPQLSPIKDLTIIENETDYLKHQEFFNNFNQNRVDTLKGRNPILGIENSGKSNCFYDTLKKCGINVTVRREFGGNIDAACGQLRAKEVK